MGDIRKEIESLERTVGKLAQCIQCAGGIQNYSAILDNIDSNIDSVSGSLNPLGKGTNIAMMSYSASSGQSLTDIMIALSIPTNRIRSIKFRSHSDTLKMTTTNGNNFEVPVGESIQFNEGTGTIITTASLSGISFYDTSLDILFIIEYTT